MSLTNFTLSAHIVILRRLRMELSVMLIFNIWWLLTISRAKILKVKFLNCQKLLLSNNFFKLYSLLGCCIKSQVVLPLAFCARMRLKWSAVDVLASMQGEEGEGGKEVGRLSPLSHISAHKSPCPPHCQLCYSAFLEIFHGSGNFGSHTSADNLARRWTAILQTCQICQIGKSK